MWTRCFSCVLPGRYCFSRSPMRAWSAFISSAVRVSTWPVSSWRVALSDARCLPSSVRGPVDFWAFRRLARSWASDGGRRIEVGELRDLWPERDGPLAVLVAEFFFEGMNDPLACEHRRQRGADRRQQQRKLLMHKREKFEK